MLLLPITIDININVAKQVKDKKVWIIKFKMLFSKLNLSMDKIHIDTMKVTKQQMTSLKKTQLNYLYQYAFSVLPIY